MPEIIFTHPEIDDTLVVSTGANQISWAYNLNTVNYPTYAGEVVQVLSCNIDNLQIEGDIRSYAEMEGIYTWFLEYMQKATQGLRGARYVDAPVKMEYPHRGWTLFIKPIQLPSMRYGREIVVPSWSMQAHIEDPDPVQRELTIDHAINGDIENFKSRVTANIGFRQANPFSDPLAVITKEESTLYPKAKDIVGLKVEGSETQTDPDWDTAIQGLAKQATDMFNALLTGDFKDLVAVYGFENVSGPTSDLASGGGTTTKPGKTK